MAQRAAQTGNAPYGAVLTDRLGAVVATAYNRVNETHDPAAHAEILAVRTVCQHRGTASLAGYRLLDNHYAPHPEWSFSHNEPAFLTLVKAYDVRLVCCAHITAFDSYRHESAHYVVSGGGGYVLCSHYGLCQPGHTEPLGTPPGRGSSYHFVDIAVDAAGGITGNVISAFEGTAADSAYRFTA